MPNNFITFFKIHKSDTGGCLILNNYFYQKFNFLNK